MLERRIFNLVNQYRKSINMPPLHLTQIIIKYARQHSKNIATNRTPFSHNGYNSRIRGISLSIPYTSAGENIAHVQGTPKIAQAALAGWLQSDGHRRVMEGNFYYTGIGAAVDSMGNYYFTQIFWR